MQYLILHRTVNANILCRAVICYLIVKCSQLRHLDKVPETLFRHYVIGDIKLKISRLLGEDGRPRIEASDVLPFKLFRTEIFEEQVQFRERVGDCRATEKSCAQILASPLLDCSDGVEKIEGAL